MKDLVLILVRNGSFWGGFFSNFWKLFILTNGVLRNSMFICFVFLYFWLELLRLKTLDFFTFDCDF